MDNWQKDLWEMLESVSTSLETFAMDVEEAIETIATDFRQDLTIDLDRFWQDWIDPLWEGDRGSEPTFLRDFRDLQEETDLMLTPYISPSPLVHKACMGCRHYHGHVYGGQLLVCGMHPYGWEGDRCPDWQEMEGE